MGGGIVVYLITQYLFYHFYFLYHATNTTHRRVKYTKTIKNKTKGFLKKKRQTHFKKVIKTELKNKSQNEMKKPI